MNDLTIMDGLRQIEQSGVTNKRIPKEAEAILLRHPGALAAYFARVLRQSDGEPLEKVLQRVLVNLGDRIPWERGSRVGYDFRNSEWEFDSAEQDWESDDPYDHYDPEDFEDDGQDGVRLKPGAKRRN